MSTQTTTPEDAPAAASRSGAAAMAALLRRSAIGRYAGVLVGLLIVSLYLTITQDTFLTWNNITNIVASNSVILILAIGATFVIISAGIDLSTVSAMAACALVFGLTLEAGWAAPVAIVATVAFGLFIGSLNGFMISKLKISFLVVTLGTLSIFQSFALVVNDGATISVFSTAGFGPIKEFVNGDLGPIPTLMIFDAVLLLVAGGVLRYTSFGRALFAVGSNPEAARLNGVNVAAVLLAVYAIAGLAAGLASVVQVGRLTGASPESDPSMLMTVIAAVLIGGTAYTGGEGGVLGTMIGVLFLGVIQNGLTLSDVSSFWQGMVSGLILIGAVGLGMLRGRGIRLRRSRASTAPGSGGPAPGPA